MIRVLQYVPSFDYGGIETFVLNMNKELKDQFHFTYLIEVDINKDLQRKIYSYGADVVRINNMSKENFFGHIKQIRKVLKEGKYDVVHVHGCDLRIFVMLFAKIYGVKKRIYHLHSARIERHEKIKKFFFNINIFLSNCLLACSKSAAEEMLGRNSKKAIIINNGIDLNKFKFNIRFRNQIRKELKILNDDIVIGHIGRLTEVKNQKFLIKIVEHIKHKNNIKLIIIGDGELKEKLLKTVKENNIEENVIFLGFKEDTSKYYSAFDIFCLPSLCEGLGIVLIEAQANGLKCLASDNVPKESNVTGEIKFLGIQEENINDWSKQIEKNAKTRYNKLDILEKKGYSISSSAKKLASVYLDKGDKYEAINQ